MSDFVVHKLNVKLLDNVDVSTSVESEPINIQSISLYCVHATWSGLVALDPLITISGSNNLNDEFIPVDSFIPNGTNGGRLLNVEKAGYAYVKVQYSSTTSSGTINVSINGKSI